MRSLSSGAFRKRFPRRRGRRACHSPSTDPAGTRLGPVKQQAQHLGYLDTHYGYISRIPWSSRCREPPAATSPACTRPGSEFRPHGKPQAISREDTDQRVESRISFPRERAVQGLARKPRFLGQRRDAAGGLGDGAQGDRHGARVALREHRFDVGPDLDFAVEMIRRAKGNARGPCSLSSIHELSECRASACACRLRKATEPASARAVRSTRGSRGRDRCEAHRPRLQRFSTRQTGQCSSGRFGQRCGPALAGPTNRPAIPSAGSCRRRSGTRRPSRVIVA